MKRKLTLPTLALAALSLTGCATGHQTIQTVRTAVNQVLDGADKAIDMANSIKSSAVEGAKSTAAEATR